MSDPFALPELPTLDLHPSWLNAAGNVDRSACVEVRVGEWRRYLHLTYTRYERSPHDGKVRPVTVTEPMPSERPAVNRHGRISTGIAWFYADMIETMLARRVPRPLRGDFRTLRAPVQRPEGFTRFPESEMRPRSSFHRKRWKGFKCRTHNGKQLDPFAQPDLPPNPPNLGPSRSKVLGLPKGWRQSVRVEKWQQGRRIKPQYYFVCPCGVPLDEAKQRTEPGLPKLSTRPAGRQAKGCPQRTLYLMLVQCTAAEWADAQAAWRWLESLPAVPPRNRVNDWWEVQATIDRVMARYGMLFPASSGRNANARRFMCRQCLGVRYGRHPDYQLAYYHRRWKQKRQERRAAARLADALRREGPGTLAWMRKVNDAVRDRDAVGEEVG